MSFGQNLLPLVFDKFAKRATCEFFLNSALFLLLVGSGPKRAMPIEKLGSCLLVSSVFYEKCTAASKSTTLQPGKKKNAHVILFTHGRA